MTCRRNVPNCFRFRSKSYHSKVGLTDNFVMADKDESLLSNPYRSKLKEPSVWLEHSDFVSYFPRIKRSLAIPLLLSLEPNSILCADIGRF